MLRPTSIDPSKHLFDTLPLKVTHYRALSLEVCFILVKHEMLSKCHKGQQSDWPIFTSCNPFPSWPFKGEDNYYKLHCFCLIIVGTTLILIQTFLGGAKLQNTRPHFTLYQTSWLVWLVCFPLPNQINHFWFFSPLPNQTSHQIHRPNT